MITTERVPLCRISLVLALTGLAVVAGLFLIPAGGSGSRSGQPVVIGSDRLISVTPPARTEGEMCQFAPAGATMSLRASLQQERMRAMAERENPPGAARREAVSRRQPVRRIQDPYSAYSSVAVDLARGEVVVTDENLFKVLVYDRLTDTPPKASMSEPKRVIGGVNTRIEFQCAVYIDPKNGDIYAVNNDSVDTMVIFSREAQGNVPPTRELETPHGTYGIAVDEGREELYLTVQHDNAVVVFHKMAKNDDSPIRFLQGDQTQLADPHGIALDLKRNRIFVSNHGAFHLHDSGPVLERDSLTRLEKKQNWPRSTANRIPGSGRNLPSSITVYSRDASGNTAPLQVIQGSKTQLNWPAHLAIDTERGELYVANDVGDSVLVFSTEAEGDVAPLRVLKGPKTGIKNPTGVFIDSEHNELWVASFGSHNVGVFRSTASGDAAPLRVIRSAPPGTPAPMLGNPHPVAYDTKREQILVPN